MFATTLQGFTLGLAMIIPIGAQNAFVLSRGIHRNHHLLTATLCCLCDLVLIGIGVFGGANLLAASPIEDARLLLLSDPGGAGVGTLQDGDVVARARKRRRPGEALVRDRGHRPHVGAMIELRQRLRLLGRHERHFAFELPIFRRGIRQFGARFRHPKVDDFHHAVVRHQNVLR